MQKTSITRSFCALARSRERKEDMLFVRSFVRCLLLLKEVERLGERNELNATKKKKETQISISVYNKERATEQ